jgi:hypothetical protein
VGEQVAHRSRRPHTEPLGEGARIRVGVQRDDPVAAVRGQYQTQAGRDGGLADAALDRPDRDPVGARQRPADPGPPLLAGGLRGADAGFTSPPVARCSAARQPSCGRSPRNRTMASSASAAALIGGGGSALTR